MPTKLELLQEYAKREGITIEEAVRQGAAAKEIGTGDYIKWLRGEPRTKIEDEVSQMQESETSQPFTLPPPGTGLGPPMPKEQIDKIFPSVMHPGDIPVKGRLIGGIAGGLAGTKYGWPIAAGLSALGGAGGETVEQLVTDQPLSGRGILEAGAEMGVSEMFGRGAGKMLGKVVGPAAARVYDEAKIAMKTLDKYMPRKFLHKWPSVLPAEATAAKGLDLLHNFAEYGIFTRRVTDYKTIIRPQAVMRMQDEWLQRFIETEGEDAVGDLFVLARDGALKDVAVQWEKYYNIVGDMMKDRMASTGALKAFAKTKEANVKALSKIEAEIGGDNLIAGILELNDIVPFSVIKELRSRLLTRNRVAKVTLGKGASVVGITKKLIHAADEEMIRACRQVNPSAAKVLRYANKLRSEGAKKFENEFIEKLVNLGTRMDISESIVKQIFKPGGISNIKKTITAVGGRNTEAWRSLQGYQMRHMVTDSMDAGIINGTKLTRALDKMGDRTLIEIFGESTVKGIKDIATTMTTIQKRTGEGTGRMLIQLTQGGVAVGLGSGLLYGELGAVQPGEVAMVLLGPIVLGRMFTNPITAKWITQGFRIPMGTAQAVAIGAKILAEKTRILEKEDRKRASVGGLTTKQPSPFGQSLPAPMGSLL